MCGPALLALVPSIATFAYPTAPSGMAVVPIPSLAPSRFVVAVTVVVELTALPETVPEPVMSTPETLPVALSAPVTAIRDALAVRTGSVPVTA
jgi:hypothetical protein